MKNISVLKTSSGFAVQFNNKQLKTPLAKDLILPNETLAEAVAEEWRAQGEKIKKETMPLTQIACVSIDLVQEQRELVLNDIMLYADTDLLCYRAGNIPALLTLQEKELTPIVHWAEKQFSLILNVTDGIMPVTQDPQLHAKIFELLQRYDNWQMAILASITKPLSSVLLAICVVEGHVDAKHAFYLSQLEETHETTQWGEDIEKERRINKLQQEILSAGEFLGKLTQ